MGVLVEGVMISGPWGLIVSKGDIQLLFGWLAAWKRGMRRAKQSVVVVCHDYTGGDFLRASGDFCVPWHLACVTTRLHKLCESNIHIRYENRTHLHLDDAHHSERKMHAHCRGVCSCNREQ